MIEFKARQTESSFLALLAIVLLAVVASLAAVPALADRGDDEPQLESECEPKKVKAAGKYYQCLVKATVPDLSGEYEPYEDRIARCDKAFDEAFAEAEKNGECRTAGGPSTIRGPIRGQLETTAEDITEGPGCPSNNLSVLTGEKATCKVSKTTSAIDLAAIVAQLSSEDVTNDTILWIQAWGAGGSAGAEGNGGEGGSGGYSQTITTVGDFLLDFGVTEMYYYLGEQGDSSNGNGGAASLVTTSDLTKIDPSLITTVLVAGAGGGGGAGRGPKTLVCGSFDSVLGGAGGSGGIAIASDASIAFDAGTRGGSRRSGIQHSGFGGGGNLSAPGGGGGGGNSVAGESGFAAFGGLGGKQTSNEEKFLNQSNTTISASGGKGGNPGDNAPGGGGGGGLGGGGGGEEGTSSSSCVSGGGGGGGSFAIQVPENVTCSNGPPTSKPLNPNGNDGFVQIVFDLGDCSTN